MRKVMISSLNAGAGKTSVIVGLAESAAGKIGYMKPLGDRLLYKKKRLWDHDSAVIASLFDLEENPEEMSIGFENAKLRYMYNEESMSDRLCEVAEHAGKGKDFLFIETGQDIESGSSINLDTLSITRALESELIFVVSGDDERIVDELAFINKYISMGDLNFKGIIINKVKDVKDFQNSYQDQIDELGVNVLGVIPNCPELTYFTMEFLANALFAKVIAGERGLSKRVKRIFVGAMSASQALEVSNFRVPDKLVITSGDRDDMLVAAMETNAAGIILTGNILPPSIITSKASELGIPLLLVSSDTYQAAKQIDELEPLLTKSDSDKAELLGSLVKKAGIKI
jgi:BioD-like phosphotransacetylase family protein